MAPVALNITSNSNSPMPAPLIQRQVDGDSSLIISSVSLMCSGRWQPPSDGVRSTGFSRIFRMKAVLQTQKSRLDAALIQFLECFQLFPRIGSKDIAFIILQQVFEPFAGAGYQP